MTHTVDTAVLQPAAYDMTINDFLYGTIIITDSGHLLSGLQNITLPTVVAGYKRTVTNSTSQSLTFAGPSGTGVTVAPGGTSLLLSDGTNWNALSSNGTSTSIALTTGTVVLSPAQYRCALLSFTGTLTGNVILVFPSIPAQDWIIDASAVNLAGHTITAQANSNNWGTTIGTANTYLITYSSAAGRLHGSTLSA